MLPSTPPLGHPWRKGRGGQVFFQACIFSQIQSPPTGHLLSLHLSREQWVKLIRSSRSPGILTDSEFSRSFLRAVDDAGSYLSRRTRPDLCVSHSALATGWGMDGWAGRETTRRGLFLAGARDEHRKERAPELGCGAAGRGSNEQARDTLQVESTQPMRGCRYRARARRTLDQTPGCVIQGRGCALGDI